MCVCGCMEKQVSLSGRGLTAWFGLEGYGNEEVTLSLTKVAKATQDNAMFCPALLCERAGSVGSLRPF